MSRNARLRLAFAGLHPDRRETLLERHGSAEAVLRGLVAGRIRASDAVRARAACGATACSRTLAEIGVTALFRGDAGYPERLGDLPGAPDVLFVRGRLATAPGVAIVGTRRCTRYGRGLARAYGGVAAEAGWPVVSGLARGIDGQAHRGTVERGGVGIAVLGSGPDVVYPPEHRDLHDALVAAGGAVVSEYPPGAPPDAWRFPVRNRIIAGLAAVVVVVETPPTGGAHITACMAAEMGRTVMAVPGDVGRATSEGCNVLIRDGATPVLDPDDFAAAVGLVLGPPRAAAARGKGRDPLVAALGPVGCSLEEAATVWEMDAAGAAASAARLEVAGLIRREDGILVPVDR